MKNLDKIFNPRTIAVIGASRDPGSVGYGILKSLVRGCVFPSEYCRPFKGNIYPVNPNAEEILGKRCYSTIKDIENNIDLAIIATPAKIVHSIIKECIKKKVGGVIIISAGFAELNEQGKKLQEDIVKDLRAAKIPLIGPNCLGILKPSINLNASFAPSMPPAGNVAFVSQSGAIADSIIDWAIENRYGFSTIITYGNKADLDVYDFLEWLENDPETKAIALYIEGIDNGSKFMEAAKKVTKTKPIVVLKAGRTEEGVKAVSSHTGSLAGSYKVYNAAFKQSGVIAAETIEDLFDLAKALATQPICDNNIAVVTNGGGCGVLCADYCSELGINLVELKKTTLIRLEKTKQMHPAYSRRNPLDIVGDALPERYKAAIEVLLEEEYISGLIIIQTLQTMTNPQEDAEVIIEAKKKYPNKPIICVYMGGKFSKRGRRMLEAEGIPDYNDIRKAVRAMWALIKRKEMTK
ncbi:CoA-binding protein [Candidatus Woesearchaeota archaeon]|nr:CoA-binding protein [Candidatus Woesearchaeota archaeon]